MKETEANFPKNEGGTQLQFSLLSLLSMTGKGDHLPSNGATKWMRFLRVFPEPFLIGHTEFFDR